MIRNNPNIKGFSIPGRAEKLAINLFADDTVLFLSEYDSLNEVQEILDRWCKVSGAKFNKEKTEIVPIGTREYREKVTTTRTINPIDIPIEENIHIANDGEAIRSLGAWIGNEVGNNQPWEPILDKICHDLEQWNKIHPTIEGKKTVIQSVIGGRTQFLTKAQGMPNEIRDEITKIIHTFIWDGATTAPIAKENLYRTIENGGINLLNIRTRNEAIDIMWLKEYLNMSPERPTWAYVADLLLCKSAPTNIPNTCARGPLLCMACPSSPIYMLIYTHTNNYLLK
jgi:Reverse transcriptase (RNA-dependent DNA polymerase)